MADKPPGNFPGSSLWSTDFELNISGRQALREIGSVEAAIDRLQNKIERLNADPFSPRVGLPHVRGQGAGAGLIPGDPTQPQYQRSVNPVPVVFSENALSGGQAAKRRDPTPVIGDAVVPDADGRHHSVRREAPSRSRNPQAYVPPERYESAFEQRSGYTPTSLYPSREMSRRERVLQQRFLRDELYGGRQVERGRDRAYTVIGPSGGIMGALPGPVAPETFEKRFDPAAPSIYPAQQMTRRERVLNQRNLRDTPFPGGAQAAADRMYTVIPPSGEIMGALPSRAGFAQGSSSRLYDGTAPFIPASSPWAPSRRARVAHSVLPGYEAAQRGLSDIGGGVGRVQDTFSSSRLMGAASSVFLLEQLGQTVGRVGQSTVGQSMRVEEYGALLANSLLGDELDRPAAERLSERLINAEYVSGLDLPTSELGLSRAALAEQYKGLAPIVRVGADGPQDFVQRMQRGATLSQLLLARDPTQGQTGVNVALSELLAGGSTRFLSLSRRFELSNSQLRRIEASEGGEGVADPVAVAIEALSEMGLGPDYLKTRARTMAGELEQSGALFANLRGDAFEQGTGVLAGNLRTVNDAFSTYSKTDAYSRQLEAGGSRIAGAFDFVTQPLVQGIAGNMLRTGGSLDESYLARSASELMQTRQGEFVNAAGEIVSAAEAFRDAAQTIHSAHLERLLEQPEYSPGQQTRMDTLLTTGLTLGGAMLANRVFGGAGGMLLRGLTTPGAGLGATLATAGAAAAPAALVAGGALAVGATVAAYRRADMSRDVYSRLEESNPQLLDDLNVSAVQRGQIGRFADRDDVLGSAYYVAMSNRDRALNLVTGGRFGERTYGERGGTFDEFLAQQGQRGGVEDALADMAASEWRPGMSKAQLVGPLRERVFDLQREGQENPDTPIGRYFQQADALELAMSAADKAWETAPESFNRNFLTSTIERAFAFSQPFGMRDPETGERASLPAGFTMEQGRQFVDRVVEDDPRLPGVVNQDSLHGTINAATERLERKLGQIEEGQQEAVTIWRRLNLSMLPGVFSDYDPNADLREIMPSRTPASALGPRDRSQLTGGGNLRRGTIQVPAIPERSEAALTRITPQPEFLDLLTPRADREIPGSSGRNRRDFERVSAEQAALFYGGDFAGKDHADHLHGGLDVLARGGYNSPTKGELTYLRTQEDYSQPLYEQMFPGGRDIYGVSAVVSDRYGKVHSVSHLQDLPSYQDGPVVPGAFIGAQGNSGLSYSKAFPEQRIQDGILPDGSSSGGRGSHGHIQFGQLKDGEYEFLDPQLGPSYWQASESERAGMGAVSFQVENHIHIDKSADREGQKRQIDMGLENLRTEIYRLYLDGTMGEMEDEVKDIKRSQGDTGDPTRPKARGK
jgi:hypothetical protein